MTECHQREEWGFLDVPVKGPRRLRVAFGLKTGVGSHVRLPAR